MGAKPVLPDPIPEGSSDKKTLAYNVQHTLRGFQRDNDITTVGVAELIGVEPYIVSPWFFTNDRVKIPRLIEMYKLYRETDVVNSMKYSPLDVHGRRMNYVHLFEGKALTNYEETLIEMVSYLRKDQEELRRESDFLRGELGLPRKYS